MSFYFVIDNVFVKKSRSKHKDTNYIVCGLFKNGFPTQIPVFEFLGDYDSGTYQINLQPNFIDLGPGDTVTFNYVIVNAGTANGAKVVQQLLAVSNQWSGGAGPNLPHFTGAVQAGSAFFSSLLSSVFNSNSCDGVVAAEQDRLSFDTDLSPLPLDQFVPHAVHQVGTNSPSGCGTNSDYTVNWHIFRSIDDESHKKKQ
jgi:hypothetical protein